MIDVPAFSLCVGGRLHARLSKSGLARGGRGGPSWSVCFSRWAGCRS